MQEELSKTINKKIDAFDHVDKILLDISAAGGGVFVDSFTTIIGAPVGIKKASYGLVFLLVTQLQ